MHKLIKFLLAMTFVFTASVANATFVNITSGVGSLIGNFDESTGSGSVAATAYERSDVGNAYSQLTDTFTTAGIFSFDWTLFVYSNSSAAGGYILNGNKIQLGFTDDFFKDVIGTTSVTLAAGDTFGWYIEAQLGGTGSLGSLNFSNASFTASPSAVPEPETAWLFGSALLGFAGMRRKQQA
jgi:hypothetical protein